MHLIGYLSLLHFIFIFTWLRGFGLFHANNVKCFLTFHDFTVMFCFQRKISFFSFFFLFFFICIKKHSTHIVNSYAIRGLFTRCLVGNFYSIFFFSFFAFFLSFFYFLINERFNFRSMSSTTTPFDVSFLLFSFWFYDVHKLDKFRIVFSLGIRKRIQLLDWYIISNLRPCHMHIVATYVSATGFLFKPQLDVSGVFEISWHIQKQTCIKCHLPDSFNPSMNINEKKNWNFIVISAINNFSKCSNAFLVS